MTAALAETEARLAGLAPTRKIITERLPPGTEPDPPETNTVYQAIVNAFNQHPGRTFRARELHELLGMPIDEATVNVTAAASDASSGKASSPNPDEAATRNGLNVH